MTHSRILDKTVCISRRANDIGKRYESIYSPYNNVNSRAYMVFKKAKSEFLTVKTRLEIDGVSHPAHADEYIYIYSHPFTHSLVVSQHTSTARLVRCFTLGSKLGWFYVSWISYRTAISNSSEGISRHMYHISICAKWLLGAQFIRRWRQWQPEIISWDCSTPTGGVYI